MAKVFDFGFAKLNVEPLMDKADAMIENIDKMSQQGWEFRSFIEPAPGSIVLFYQKEKAASTSPVVPSQPPAPATPAL